MSSIILASAYGGAVAAAQRHDRHDGHAAPLSPDQLGGAYEFTDVKGRRVTAADFEGHWTLLFFGYARCKSSCPVATPKIVKAARLLREQGRQGAGRVRRHRGAAIGPGAPGDAALRPWTTDTAMAT